MKTKYAKETLQAFKKMISRKNNPEKRWVDKGAEYGGIDNELNKKCICRESHSIIKIHYLSLHRRSW